jgi:hypothetical protein
MFKKHASAEFFKKKNGRIDGYCRINMARLMDTAELTWQD